MGCTTSYHTHFTPPIDKIREELSSIPDPTATDVADLTANVMLAEWEKQCGYVISRYKTQMRRDMLRDARKEVEALKPSVLAAVDAKIKALEELEQENQPLHATPARTIRARPTTPTIDDIDTAFKSVEIRRPETPRSLRVKTIKTSTPRPSAPGHFSSPRYITSRSGTPFESPVKARARSGHKHGAMLRPDDAFPRISRAQPPPRCVFKPDD
ncbi:hypothetical protein F4803DRAFT_531338 [Xylaria telfairii]|nr:hypothetical protein F4803DRAFT_531338 [Xylaria telfairii]